MLDPRDRQLLLESLRPPDGYRLDHAIGTSYTLDLVALLTASLAFTLQDWEDREGNPTADPIALLESVRRNAGRITLFCQAGNVRVPPPAQRLVAYLEQCIAEVQAPHPEGIFHPKVWLLRYLRAGEPVRYRFVCLTRNLTFDKSWDSILVLEGELLERKVGIAKNHPLGNFMAALPSMATRALTPERAERVSQMASEVRRVRFEAPSDVDDFKFWPLGVDGSKHWPFIDAAQVRLVVAPFLSAGFLNEVSDGCKKCILISRPDQLAEMSPAVLGRFAETYAMDSAAEDIGEDPEANAVPELAGLHAKLFVTDAGWDAHVLTGSANATGAAFGQNVEFTVELIGKKSRLGVDRFLGEASGKNAGFRRLLQPWSGQSVEVAEETRIRRQLESKLNHAAKLIASTPLSLRCVSESGDRFRLQIEAERALPDLGALAVVCWPSSLKREVAVVPEKQAGVLAAFGPVALDAITGFIAFELTAAEAALTVTHQFAINVPIHGAPADRLDRLLASQLKNQEQFLRLLWLLLQLEISTVDSEEASSLLTQQLAGARRAEETYPIFEELVRSLARSGERVREAGRLIEDLMRTPEGQALIPPALVDLWNVIKLAMNENDAHTVTA